MDKILIIGGSSGIGHEIIERLPADIEVINFSRTPTSASHPNLTHHKIDVMVDEIPLIEGVNTIIYCPGSINLKPITSLTEEDFLNDFSINILGAVRVVKTYVRALKKMENASILFFSTVAVAQGMPFHSSVAVSKAGIEGLTKSLAAELAPHIRVNCIAPTAVNTPLASHLFRNEKSIENIKNRHPLQITLEPEDIAETAIFLTSGKARAITGQIVGIDAGLSSLKL